MSHSSPLTGMALVSCAQANASLGLPAASKSCGFGENYDHFKTSLIQACNDIGIDIQSLKDLVKEKPQHRQTGLQIEPDSQSQL